MTDWQRIVTKHSDVVWRTAFWLLGNKADAADCYQEAFMAALEIARRGKVRNWPALLKTLATRKAMDQLRSRYKRSERLAESAELAALLNTDQGPAELALSTELTGLLRQTLALLPAEQAEAISLFYLGEMKYSDISELLGVKTSTVGTLLRRGRLRLRKLLESSANVESEAVQ